MALDHLRPFVFDVRGQTVSFCGVGLCDNNLIANVNAVTGFVYQHGMFQWNVDPQTGAISLPTGAEVDMFVTGIGQPIPGGWWNQTAADTNLLLKKDGAPVDRNYVFIARGVMLDLPEAVAKADATATSNRVRPTFMADQADGPGYTRAMQSAQANYTALLLSQSDTGCTYRIGLFKHNPGWINVDGQNVTNGQFSGPWFVPFAVAFCFGSSDDIRQITVQAVFGQGYTIPSDGATPVTPVQDNIMYQPFELTFIGNIACVPDCLACSVPTPSDLTTYRQMGLAPTMAPVMSPPQQFAQGTPGTLYPGLPPGTPRPV